MKESIREANEKGMPIYAELWWTSMYLCESIHDFEGAVYDTVGIVPAKLHYATKATKSRVMLRLQLSEIPY